MLQVYVCGEIWYMFYCHIYLWQQSHANPLTLPKDETKEIGAIGNKHHKTHGKTHCEHFEAMQLFNSHQF